jgi:hypothetical protein
VVLEGERFDLKRGEAVVFRGDVIHQGMGGEQGNNVRLFFYIDTQESMRRYGKFDGKYRRRTGWVR